MALCEKACCNPVARAAKEQAEQAERDAKRLRYYTYLRSQGIELDAAEVVDEQHIKLRAGAAA